MAKEAMKIFLLATAIAAASFWIPAAGQSGCTTALIGLSPCLNYISGSSSTPSSSCCSQLGSIVQSQPQCLCMVVNGGGSILGISINKTQALALPSACRVQTPPASACNGGSSGSPPVSPQAAPSAPAASSAPSTPSAPSAPSTPTTTPEAPSSPTDTPSTLAPTSSSSGNGSKSSNGDSSDGKMNKSLMSVVFAALIFGSSLWSFF